MTIEKLNEILSCRNLNEIDLALKQNGYRYSSDGEFDIFAIANSNRVYNSERFEDVFDDKIYVGDIHTEISKYQTSEFIVVSIYNVFRDKGNKEQLSKLLIYTSAPIDEAFEREQSQLYRCSLCKKQFASRDLCEINGQLVCDKCFEKDLKKLIAKGKSKIIKKVK